MIIVLTDSGKPVDAFLRVDGTTDTIEIDTHSPIAKLIKVTADNKEATAHV